MKKLFILLVCLLPVLAQAQMETSVAGFIPLSGSGRIVYNFNPGWRFHRGDIKGAEAVRFDDTSWQVVSVPHTVELMPAEASGCRNYQGVAWYRKHFVIPQDMKGKEVSLHFEGAMGKQVIYLNGKRVQEHLGGYLPFTVQLTELGVQPGDSCLLAVMTDNSDDKNFPPGKRQYTLDFAYHGGIYRDVWMIGKSSVAITDALEADKVAGGGVFVHFDNISGKKAEVYVDTGKWKARQGGNGLAAADDVKIKFTNCTAEEHAKIYSLTKPFDDSFIGMMTPFGVVAPEFGRKLIQETIIVDVRTKVPIISIQPFSQDGYEYAVKIKTMNVAKHDDLQRMIGYQVRKFNACRKCLKCESICKQGAIMIVGDEYIIDPDKCVRCKKCVSAKYLDGGCMMDKYLKTK